jgi:hypothetical protein
MIAVETATVYRAAGRRWLTRAAAIKALARAKIREHCYCEPAERDNNGNCYFPGVVCRYHDEENYGRVMTRLARFYASVERRRRATA